MDSQNEDVLELTRQALMLADTQRTAATHELRAIAERLTVLEKHVNQGDNRRFCTPYCVLSSLTVCWTARAELQRSKMKKVLNNMFNLGPAAVCVGVWGKRAVREGAAAEYDTEASKMEAEVEKWQKLHAEAEEKIETAAVESRSEIERMEAKLLLGVHTCQRAGAALMSKVVWRLTYRYVGHCLTLWVHNHREQDLLNEYAEKVTEELEHANHGTKKEQAVKHMSIVLAKWAHVALNQTLLKWRAQM